MKKHLLKIAPAIITGLLILSGCGTGKMLKNAELLNYSTEPEILENHGGEVAVSIKGDIPAKFFHKKAAVSFQPVLKYDDGQSLSLKPMALQGEKLNGNGQVINFKEGGSFTYNDVIPFKEGMQNAELIVNPVLYQGIVVDKDLEIEKIKEQTPVKALGEVKLADGVINTSQNIVHLEKLLVATRETADQMNMDLSPYYEKETIVSEKAALYFRLNMHNLNIWLPLNRDKKAKAKRDDFFSFIDQGWKIKNIEIDAWASPEGEESFNEGLSDRRAATGKNYLLKELKKLAMKDDDGYQIKDAEKEINFISNANGEDWNGFLNAVENSGIKDKNLILNVVRSQPNVSKREEEIRNMTLVYEEIKDDILPPLRRVEFTVNCYEPKKAAEVILKLAIEEPQKLDNKELLYAATLTDDITTKYNIYKEHTKLFPEDWKGFNNAAAMALQLKKTEEATVFMNKASSLNHDNPFVRNNMAVISSKNKDYKKAEKLLNDAKNLGGDVSYNMALIHIIEGDYSTALKELGKTKCDPNLGLIKLLTRKTEEAIKSLECSPDIACKYYLLAVCGARTNNDTMIYSNLEKAISMNPELKDRAASDREFIRFFNEDSFIDLVK